MNRALGDASRLRATFVGDSGYGLAYGSHPCADAGTDSDLDLLYVTTAPLEAGRLAQLVDEVVALHTRHGLGLDDEVAHEVKLHATTTEVNAALALRGFTIDSEGDLAVPTLVAEGWFLNSTPFKLRLILNALTTPHLFLGGNVEGYQRHRAGAERALALLALSLLDGVTIVTGADAAHALLHAPDGASGKDYLGYTQTPALYGTVQSGLAHLAAERVVDPIDGAHFEQDHAARKAAILHLTLPTASPASYPHTSAPRQHRAEHAPH